jgi:RNA polymerase sigma-70 factor (ECF subfamily)
MTSKFERLFDMYYDDVYRYIFVNVKDKRNSEDIIATVFTRIYEHKDRIIDLEASENWVFQIAHNAIINFYVENNCSHQL